MSFTLQPVRVANGSDEEGLLVFNGHRRLVAVLTHLSDQYDGVSGHWYLEAGFGRLDGPDHPTFANLQEAQEWLRQHLPVMRGGGSLILTRPRHLAAPDYPAVKAGRHETLGKAEAASCQGSRPLVLNSSWSAISC
jgi:hypothetical protein